MKRINKNSMRRLLKEARTKRKIKLFVYIALRALVFISMLSQAYQHNWNNVALCILTLVLFTVPGIISKQFNIKFPETLEIIVYLFIFSAEILGEIQNFYNLFEHWDTILHTINGFLCGAIGFSLVDILNHNEDHQIHMSPSFAALVAFSFSMTVGVLWEFGEYTVDHYLLKDMQKDKIVENFQSIKVNPEGVNIPVIINDIERTEIYYNNGNVIKIDGGYLDIGLNDTMKDLIVNFIGAFVFSIFGYLYVKNREGYKFLEIILPRKKVEE